MDREMLTGIGLAIGAAAILAIVVFRVADRYEFYSLVGKCEREIGELTADHPTAHDAYAFCKEIVRTRGEWRDR